MIVVDLVGSYTQQESRYCFHAFSCQFLDSVTTLAVLKETLLHFLNSYFRSHHFQHEISAAVRHMSHKIHSADNNTRTAALHEVITVIHTHRLLR